MRAIWVDTDDAGYRAELRDDVDESTFTVAGGAGDVDAEWSTVNYKDALAITGTGRALRPFPLVPGIGLAGTVTASESARVAVGTTVLGTGYGLGEAHHGGLAEHARVPAAPAVTTPGALTTKEAMSIGTAG